MLSRVVQIEDRLIRSSGYFTPEILNLIKDLSREEKEWFDGNKKYTYEEFVKLRPWESNQNGEAPEVSSAPEWEPEELTGLNDIPDSEFENPLARGDRYVPLFQRVRIAPVRSFRNVLRR